MPLVRMDDAAFRLDLEGVSFGMKDEASGRPVRCLCLAEALEDRGAQGKAAWLPEFLISRSDIEEAASAIYDSGQCCDGEVRISSRELNPGTFDL